jgi:hypothetical protein
MLATSSIAVTQSAICERLLGADRPGSLSSGLRSDSGSLNVSRAWRKSRYRSTLIPRPLLPKLGEGERVA